MATFINPFVDRGFKLLFGREDSKILLIDLLNDLLEGERAITELSFMNVEAPAESPDSRMAVFDLKCKDKDGTYFIVEIQNSLQAYFYERGLYYLCRMICDQDKRGDAWNFALCPVYGIFFLNFKSGKTDKVRTDVVLADRENGLQVSNLIREVYIEMPFFCKKETDCNCGLDYWLYTLKYMEKFEALPFKGQKALFEKLERLSKIVNLNKKERMEYEECLKIYRDNKNCYDYAVENGYKEGLEKGLAKGIEKGIEKGKATALRDVALKLKSMGVELTSIIRSTGLTAEEINAL